MSDAKTKILLVCANPRGTNPLRTAEEDRTLRESIQLSPNRDAFTVETLNAATIDDLRRALLRSQVDIVHFSGHGTQAGLVFEDSAGRLSVPESVALADLMQRRKVRVALLNACYSLSVGRLSAIGLEYTIASTGPISDPGAIEFARGFYDALGAGNDVVDAYAEGLSAARLKGLNIDAILLRNGETYVPIKSNSLVSSSRQTEQSDGLSLLGVAIDTSGSMQESIRNRAGETVTRFAAVKAALADVGSRVRDELARRGPETNDSFEVFLYAFGLRIGKGVADMGSLWKATQNINMPREIEIRKRRYETDARGKATKYAGLASLVKSYGLGGLVDAVAEAATHSVESNIVGEISTLVLNEASRIGDTTLSAKALAELFNAAPIDADEQMQEHILFGSTPLLTAAFELKRRFELMAGKNYAIRTLLVISDGEPTDGDPRAVLREIRDSGVNIVACFVTGEDVAAPRVLHGAPVPSWPEGARLMWDISSPIDEDGPTALFLLSCGWALEPNARLFAQANHSDVLKEFLTVTGSGFGTDAELILPQGQ